MRHGTAHDVKLIVYEAAFAGLAVACAYLLTFIPNVELFTFVVFLSGVLLGVPSGIRVGALAAIVYGLTSPWGLPPLPLLGALVVSRMVIGALGGWAGPRLLAQRGRIRRIVLLAGWGLLASAVFNALTTLVDALTIGQWGATFVRAFPFVLANLISNVVVFPVLGTACIELAHHLPIPGPGRQRHERE